LSIFLVHLGALACPSTPEVMRSKKRAPTPNSFIVFTLVSHLNLSRSLGARHHKPLEWLATISNPFGRKGMWLSMFQDFNFKIVHRVIIRHVNANGLSHNPINTHDEDDDFGVEIQDEKKNVSVAQVWKSTTLNPHIFTIS
jgi:hypothetical protein